MNITVFSTTNCGICHALMQWLDKNSFAYDNKIVDKSDEAMAAFLSVNDGIIGTPFTVINADDGTVTKIAGFDQAKLRTALNIT